METKNIDNDNVLYKEQRRKLAERHSALSGKAQIELAQITADNKELLKRIENVLPTYSFQQYEAEEILHRRHLRVLSEHPESLPEDSKDSMVRNLSKKQLKDHLIDKETNEFAYMHAMPVFTSSFSAQNYQHNRTKIMGDISENSSNNKPRSLSASFGPFGGGRTSKSTLKNSSLNSLNRRATSAAEEKL